MIKNIVVKLVLIILILAVIAIAGLLISGQVTGTNKIEELISAVKNLINPDQEQETVNSGPLEIQYNDKVLVTLQNSATFTLKSKTELKESSSAKYQFNLSQRPKDEDPYYWYVVKINNIGVGEFNIVVVLEDVNGSVGEITVKGQRDAYTLPFGLTEISDWDTFSYTADGDSLKALVDKQNKLPLDYEPKQLVDVNKDLLLYTNSSLPILVTAETGDALKVMAGDLQRELNKNLVIASGYRSYLDQYRTYAGWVRQYGQEEADKVSARPGFSEHQLGTAVDFVDQETGFDLTNNFENGIAGRWLMENAHKYGFVQSYPAGKDSETGYQHEAWHWRYIGIENAKEYKDSGLTLNIWLSQNR